jgi:hypothetical protein
MQKLQQSWVGSQHPPTHWYLWGGSEAVLNKEHKKSKKSTWFKNSRSKLKNQKPIARYVFT